MYIDDKLPKNIVLSWLNIRPLLKQFNHSKKYELKKNDLISHLKNIQKYFRLHDLQIENDYVIRAIGSKIDLDRFYENADTELVIDELIKISKPNLDIKTLFIWPEAIIPNMVKYSATK